MDKDIILKNDLFSEEKYKKLFHEEYLRIIVESSLDGISVVDDKGKFEFANDSFFRIIEWPKEEIIGNYFTKIIPEEMNEFIFRQWNNVREGNPDDFETKIITKSGEIKYVKVAHTLTNIKGEKKVVSVTMDITENKKLEKDLKESEARYRDLFENANDPIYIHNADGFILNVNDAGLAALKCTREEFIGSHISRWLTQESFLKFKERLFKRNTGENIEQPVVIEVICKDREHRWAEIRTRVIYENGLIKEIHGIARDITEKKKLEDKLRESEDKYRDLFDNAQDAMYVLDKECVVLKMNKTGLEILGCSKEEVVGNNISKWLTQDSIKIAEERRRISREGKQVNKTDILEIVTKNGEHRWIEIKTRQIKKNGKIIEIHGIGRDITENRILKKELNKSNNQRKLLCYLIEGSRGGKTRSLILKRIAEKSYNANQLAKYLNKDYKTIRHHLNVLIKNGIIIKKDDGYIDLYYISRNIESDLNEVNQETQYNKTK